MGGGEREDVGKTVHARTAPTPNGVPGAAATLPVATAPR